MAPAAQPSLSREQIASSALDYLDRHGLEALSMRRLAAELGVTPMSLYRYFAGKRELLDAAVDAAFAASPPPERLEGTWREQLTAIAHGARATLDRHPSIAQIRVLQPVLGPQALQFGEAVLAILEEAGLTRDEAVNGYRLLFTYTLGFAAFSPAHAEREARAAAEQALSALPPEYYPHLAASIEQASEAMSGDAVFSYGLERLLDGLELRISAQA